MADTEKQHKRCKDKKSLVGNPICLIASLARDVSGERLTVIAELLAFMKEMPADADCNAVKEIASWLETRNEIANTDVLSTGSGIHKSLTKVMKSLCSGVSVVKCFEFVIQSFLETVSKRDFERVISNYCQSTSSPNADSTLEIEEISGDVITRVETVYPHIDILQKCSTDTKPFLYDANYNPCDNAWSTIRNMKNWKDVRQVPIWDSAPLESLFGNCRLMMEKHSEKYTPETILPLYTMSSVVYTDTLFCTWIEEGWKVLKKSNDLEEGYRQRRDGLSGLDLTDNSVKELLQNHSIVDREIVIKEFRNDNCSGRYGCGQLLSVVSIHGIDVFKMPLQRNLSYGGDTLYLVRYDQIYRNHDSVSLLGPLSESVLWIPDIDELFNKSMPLTMLPPSGVIEYIHSRSSETVLNQNIWECCSYRMTQIQRGEQDVFSQILKDCDSVLNPQQIVPSISNRLLDLLENQPKPKYVLPHYILRTIASHREDDTAPCHSNIDSATSVIQVWNSILLSTAGSLARKYLTDDTLIMTWETDSSEKIINDNVKGRLLLLDLTKAPVIEIVQSEMGRTFVNDKILSLSCIEKTIGDQKLRSPTAHAARAKAIQKEKLAVAVEVSEEGRDISNCKIVTDISQIKSIIPHLSPEAVGVPEQNVLFSQATVINPSDFNFTLLRDFLNDTSPAIGEYTPHSIIQSLKSLQLLSFYENDLHSLGRGNSHNRPKNTPSKVFLLSFNESSSVRFLQCGTKNMIKLRRVCQPVDNQPESLINKTLTAFERGEFKPEIEIPSMKVMGGKYNYADGIFKHGKKPNMKLCWNPDPEGIHPPWLLTDDLDQSCIRLHSENTMGSVPVDIPKVTMKGFLAPQIKSLVWYADQAILKLPANTGIKMTYFKGSTIYLKNYDYASVIRWDSYTYASPSSDEIRRCSALLEIQQTSSCQNIKSVAFCSRFQRRDEVIMARGSSFQIIASKSADLCSPQNIKLREVTPQESLQIYVRSIVPKITHRDGIEHTRELFDIAHAIRDKLYACALEIATSPTKNVLYHVNDSGVQIGLVISNEIIQLLKNFSEIKQILNSALLEAANRGKKDAIKLLVSLGADPSCVSEGIKSETPLHITARGGSISLLHELIIVGADTAAVNYLAETPLHISVCTVTDWDVVFGFEVFSSLASHRTLQRGDLRRATPLHHAAGKGKLQAVRMLLNLGAQPNFIAIAGIPVKPGQEESDFGNEFTCESEQQHSCTSSPLHCATAGGHLSVIQLLLDKGADCEVLDSKKQTALHVAIQSGNFSSPEGLPILSRLLTIKTVTSADTDRLTPLHIAAALGERDIARLILNTPNIIIKELTSAIDYIGCTPLQKAANTFQIDVVLLLSPITDSALQRSDFPTQVRAASGLLEAAAMVGDLDRVALFLNSGVSADFESADGQRLLQIISSHETFACERGLEIIKRIATSSTIRHADKYKNTALHSAAQKGLSDICRALVQRGADSNLRNLQGITPLHIAAKLGLEKIMHVLVWSGEGLRPTANLNSQDNEKRTPLHHAAELGHLNVVRFLKGEQQVNLTITNKAGHTAEVVAAINEHVEVVHLLKSSPGKLKLPAVYAKKRIFKLIEEANFDEIVRITTGFIVDLAMERWDNRLQSILKPIHTAVLNPKFNTEESLNAIMSLSHGNVIHSRIGSIADIGEDLTSLHIAAFFNYFTTISHLLKAGCNPNRKSNMGVLPIEIAAYRLHMNSVFCLEKSMTGYTVSLATFPICSIHMLAVIGNTDGVLALIKLGQDPFEPDCRVGNPGSRPYPDNDTSRPVGTLPLHVALSSSAMCADMSVLKLLMSSKAVATITPTSSNTPLHIACQYDEVAAAAVLVEYGADISAVNRFNKTPLDIAIQCGHVCMIQLLLSLQSSSVEIPEHISDWMECKTVQVHSCPKKLSDNCQNWLLDANSEGLLPHVIESVLSCKQNEKLLGASGTVLTVTSGYVNIDFGELGKQRFPASAVIRHRYPNSDRDTTISSVNSRKGLD